MATDFLDRAGKDRAAAEAAMVQAIPMRSAGRGRGSDCRHDLSR
nr:hypothetical protein [Hoeflea alexandrii]